MSQLLRTTRRAKGLATGSGMLMLIKHAYLSELLIAFVGFSMVFLWILDVIARHQNSCMANNLLSVDLYLRFCMLSWRNHCSCLRYCVAAPQMFQKPWLQQRQWDFKVGCGITCVNLVKLCVCHVHSSSYPMRGYWQHSWLLVLARALLVYKTNASVMSMSNTECIGMLRAWYIWSVDKHVMTCLFVKHPDRYMGVLVL